MSAAPRALCVPCSIGADRVARALRETAEYLEHIVKQAMDGINGVRLWLASATHACANRI